MAWNDVSSLTDGRVNQRMLLNKKYCHSFRVITGKKFLIVQATDLPTNVLRQEALFSTPYGCIYWSAASNGHVCKAKYTLLLFSWEEVSGRLPTYSSPQLLVTSECDNLVLHHIHTTLATPRVLPYAGVGVFKRLQWVAPEVVGGQQNIWLIEGNPHVNVVILVNRSPTKKGVKDTVDVFCKQGQHELFVEGDAERMYDGGLLLY